MPVGGKLVFKGGGSLKPDKDIKKKKKEKKLAKKLAKAAADADADGGNGIAATGVALPALGGKAKSYEEEFAFETARANRGMGKNTPWGSGYAKTPEILHGYDKKISDAGANASERLDLRCAKKADKFCK